MKKITTTIFTVCLSGIISVAIAQRPSAGDRHGFYLCPNNVPVTWGEDADHLGTGDGLNHYNPILVPNLTGITKAEAARKHSVFLKNDGTVLTVGKNFYGQLGDGTTTDTDVPVALTSLSGIMDISANNYGDFTLFLKNDSTVWACGYNNVGQLGDGTSANQTTPVQVSALAGIKAISAGESHSLFLKGDGTVWGVGANSQYGQLGDGTNMNTTVPVQVSGISDIVAIEAGYGHSLFLKSDGTVWACGGNSNGQLGDSSTTNRNAPVQVYGLDSIIEIAAGEKHSLFLQSNGNVWACGGDLPAHGNGTLFGQPLKIPVLDTLLSDIVHISAGTGFSIFVKNDGTVLTCGLNNYGQLGTGAISGLPVAVPAARTMPPACNITTAIAEAETQSTLSIYPNPAKETVTIGNVPSGSTIRIMDMLGKQVYNNQASATKEIINIDIFTNGIYLIQIETSRQIVNKKLVVNK